VSGLLQILENARKALYTEPDYEPLVFVAPSFMEDVAREVIAEDYPSDTILIIADGPV
jgi:hypothetical protein